MLHLDIITNRMRKDKYRFYELRLMAERGSEDAALKAMDRVMDGVIKIMEKEGYGIFVSAELVDEDGNRKKGKVRPLCKNR